MSEKFTAQLEGDVLKEVKAINGKRGPLVVEHTKHATKANELSAEIQALEKESWGLIRKAYPEMEGKVLGVDVTKIDEDIIIVSEREANPMAAILAALESAGATPES